MRPETAFVLIRQIRKIGCLHPHDNRKSAGPDKNHGRTSIKKFLLPLNKLIIPAFNYAAERCVEIGECVNLFTNSSVWEGEWACHRTLLQAMFSVHLLLEREAGANCK